jgi:ubiquinone/menaquinone biosynthesis C-methylase UbiE
MTNSAQWSALAAEHVAKDQAEAHTFLQLQCPSCRKPLLACDAYPQPFCAQCGFQVLQENGVFRALPQDRALYFRQFIRDYEMVREKEGRGSSSADYYLQLPYQDATARNSWQWEIRGRTFRYMERHILPAIERANARGCDILDLGAGNCWLSFRLALRGHRPVAVDLLDNEGDGLGSARHYFDRLRRPFARFQAEMDRLPFSDKQFDVAVFNASFHYSVDYEQTLRETLRCLRRPGYVIIADSPFYWHDASGQLMREEKHAAFQKQFGFRSDSIPSREYLTSEILDELGARLGLKWQILRPWYGLNWALRPLKARLLRRREPSKFLLICAAVTR